MLTAFQQCILGTKSMYTFSRSGILGCWHSALFQKKWEIFSNSLLFFIVFHCLTRGLLKLLWEQRLDRVWLIYQPSFKMISSWNTEKPLLLAYLLLFKLIKVAAKLIPKLRKCHFFFFLRWKLCLCIQWTISESWLYQECQSKLVCEHKDRVHSIPDIFDIHKERSEGE